MRVAFSNGVISAVADTLGAELVSVKLAKRERLWQNETGEWAGHAPVLFPVCGKCAVRVGWRELPMERHGFAKSSEFILKSRKKNAVCFELRSNSELKKKFPYDFVFRVRYSLRGWQLRIAYEIENPGEGTLYCSCGGHESFALERPLGEYVLRFPRLEKFEALLHNNEGLLTGEIADMGRSNSLPLSEEFLKNGKTLILSQLRSRSVMLCTGERAVAEITFRGFSNLLLWRAGEAQMICIEPWHNLPDTAGKKVCKFPEREGIFSVPPHGKKKFVREIEYL